MRENAEICFLHLSIISILISHMIGIQAMLTYRQIFPGLECLSADGSELRISPRAVMSSSPSLEEGGVHPQDSGSSKDTYSFASIHQPASPDSAVSSETTSNNEVNRIRSKVSFCTLDFEKKILVHS